MQWLPDDELMVIFENQSGSNCVDKSARIIGGRANFKEEELFFILGNSETGSVPFSWFNTSVGCIKSDFSKLGFTDYGYVIVIGEHKVASRDVILYIKRSKILEELSALSQELGLYG